MFGLSLEHLLILLVAGLFILGPERLPETVRWLAQTLRKARTFAAGVQDQVQNELGPELTQLRKPLQELSSFDPKAALGRHLLGDGFSENPSQTGTTATAESQPPRPARTVTPLRPGERAPVDPDAT